MDDMDTKHEGGGAVRAKAGSAEAFGTLIEAHYRSVFAVAYSRVQRWDAAEDLAQDTFLTAWRHRDTLRDPAKFPAWAMQIARNLSRNWLRSAAYRRQLAERAETEAAQPDSAAPQERAAIVGERDEAVDKAIAALPEPLREVIVLYYLHDESAESTGRLLGISAAAVRKRTQRARELMRERLEKNWESAFSARAKGLPVQQRAARVSALLALPPASAPLAKAAAVDAAAFVAAAGAGIPASTGAMIGAGILVAAGILAGIGIPWLREASTAAEPSVAVVTASATETAPESGIPDTAPLPESVPPAPLSPSAEPIAETLAAAPAAAAAESAAEPAARFSVSGVVVDTAGNAVRGARVDLTPSAYREAWSSSSPMTIRQIESDAAGGFRIEDIPAGSYRIAASMDGFGDSDPQTISLDPAHTTAESPISLILDLLEGAELYAQLFGKDGRPLANAIVDCRGFVSEHGSRSGRGNIAVTDGRGNFSMDVPGLGMATLVVRGQSGEQVVMRNVPVDPANRVPVKWPETATLEGVISGDGAAGAVVRLDSRLRMERVDENGLVTSSSITAGPVYEVQISASGAYRIDSVSVDLEYTFAIVGGENAYLTPRIPMPPFEAGETARFDYALSALTRVTGVVRGAVSNRPLRDLMVKWQSLDDPKLADTTFIDADGTFDFDLRVAAGRYSFMAAYRTNSEAPLDSRYIQTVAIEPGADIRVDLTFPDSVTRTIVVVDEAGTPIENASLTYVQENAAWGWGLQTDAAGKASYGGVVPGDLIHFEVQKRGYEHGQTAAFTGNPGDVFDPETVVLRKEE